jgi:hypothetical protein
MTDIFGRTAKAAILETVSLRSSRKSMTMQVSRRKAKRQTSPGRSGNSIRPSFGSPPIGPIARSSLTSAANSAFSWAKSKTGTNSKMPPRSTRSNWSPGFIPDDLGTRSATLLPLLKALILRWAFMSLYILYIQTAVNPRPAHRPYATPAPPTRFHPRQSTH